MKTIKELKREIKEKREEIIACEGCNTSGKIVFMCQPHEGEAMALQSQFQTLKDILKLAKKFKSKTAYTWDAFIQEIKGVQSKN